jgi:FlaA1/EpsC-like NDP-sugar epimerase
VLTLATGDVVLWGLSCWLAFLIRFDGRIPAEYTATIPLVLIAIIPTKLAWFALFRLYQVTWRLVGITEVIPLGQASTLASLTVAGGFLLLREFPPFGTFPRSVLILDFLVGTAFVTLFRLSPRLLGELANGRVGRKHGVRVLLVGAGAAGERVARSMIKGGIGARCPVGFIDDDSAKHGSYVHGLKVHGGREAIPDAVRNLTVDEVVITIPSAPAAAIRDIVRYTRQAGLKQIKVLPSIAELFAGRAPLQGIRDIDVEDLLGREVVRLDPGRVNAFLVGRTILITGAGGSIGAELVRQLSRSAAARLILVDNNESALFDLEGELAREQPTLELHPLIADVRDADKMHRVFEVWRPDVVYHAAAYKHVPLMEINVDEAVRTNIFGTLTVAEAALASRTQTFVMISTDKAVNPSSVMGATKRVAELLIKALNARGVTRFMAVRFGNVIGSRGSVIPTMKEQIRRGGPVTVTHPEMTRYFMSPLEAVALVLQASAMKDPHDIFTLDMGGPVKILELAQELIRLSGFEPDKDIPIVFSGIRPGEKLQETLQTPDEPLELTEVPKIFALTSNGRVDEITLRLALRELDRLSRAVDVTGLKSILQRLSNGLDHMPLVAGTRE